MNASSSSSSPPASSSWKADVKSGFLVFLIALPLCLGISIASGFPPVAGILTASVGGILATWMGSAPLTIKGPAAGLIVIALGSVNELGQGDAMVGYRRALAVGMVAAGFQIVFALLRLGTVGIAMSPSVVHGMLAAIGVIIMSKQLHVVVGVKPAGKEPLELLMELPKSFMEANPEVLLIGVLSLAILFGHQFASQRGLVPKRLRAVPAQVLVLLAAVPLGLYFELNHAHDYAMMSRHFHVGPQYLVTLPGHIWQAITTPDFSAVTSATSVKYIIMYTLVGSVESVLSALAVDALDPKKRASNLNKDLLAVGVGNLLAAAIGGLPMISEIVRSKANIDAGAQSSKSNFMHGVFLLCAVATIPGLLHMIPLAALAAMLVFTGSRLASPKEFAHAKEIGRDQLALFLVTLLVTLATDLLVGVAAGLALELVFHLVRGAGPWTLFFGSHVTSTRHNGVIEISIEGAASFACLLKLRQAVLSIDETIEVVRIDVTRAKLVDHTFLNRVHGMSDEWNNARLEFVGLQSMRAMSDHPHASRRSVV